MEEGTWGHSEEKDLGMCLLSLRSGRLRGFQIVLFAMSASNSGLPFLLDGPPFKEGTGMGMSQLME